MEAEVVDSGFVLQECDRRQSDGHRVSGTLLHRQQRLSHLHGVKVTAATYISHEL